jgi:hypothetical protein
MACAGAARSLSDVADLGIVSLGARRERRVVPDLLVVRVALERAFAQDVIGIDVAVRV